MTEYNVAPSVHFGHIKNTQLFNSLIKTLPSLGSFFQAEIQNNFVTHCLYFFCQTSFDHQVVKYIQAREPSF